MEEFIKLGALERDYYIDSENVGSDSYNTYGQFLTGSRGDENLKKFKINNPMLLKPSYGSSAEIEFELGFSKSNNGHKILDMHRLNRVSFLMNLKFDNINIRDANYLVRYIEDKKAGTKFMFQPENYESLLADHKYKSLYSIPPYFVQEFECESYSIDSNSEKTTSVSTAFLADNFSQLNLRNIIYIESMPEFEKEIINDYFFKEELDINPSYSQGFSARGSSKTFSEGKSLAYSESDTEMEFNNSASLVYKGVSDLEALKIISFFLQKQSFETFKFKTKGLHPRELHMHCKKITHNFIFKNSNDISVSIAEHGFSMKNTTSI